MARPRSTGRRHPHVLTRTGVLDRVGRKVALAFHCPGGRNWWSKSERTSLRESHAGGHCEGIQESTCRLLLRGSRRAPEDRLL